MENFKKPVFIIFITAAAITMLGAALGWFSIGNELIRSIAEAELAKKQNLAIGLSAASLGTCILAIKVQKHRLAFLSAIVSIYQLIMIINQKPEAAIAEQINLQINIGYWLSIIGTLVMIVIAAMIGIKGVHSTTEE